MRGNVFRHALRIHRKGLIGWGIGLAALVLMSVAFYPSVRDSPDLNQLVESLPPAMKALMGGVLDFTTPAGYLHGRLFSMMVPVLFIVYAVGRGSDAIAGEEERRTLDLVLSYPVERSRFVLEKAVALGAGVALLAGVLWLTLWVGAGLVDMDIGPWPLARATLLSALLGLLFGAFALAVGAVKGRKGLATGAASAAAVALYFVNALAPLNEATEAARYLSPFYYAIGDNPLSTGLAWSHVVILAGLSVLLVTVAMGAFNNRDVGK